MQGVFPSPRKEAQPEGRDSKIGLQRHRLLATSCDSKLAVPLNKYQLQLARRVPAAQSGAKAVSVSLPLAASPQVAGTECCASYNPPRREAHAAHSLYWSGPPWGGQRLRSRIQTPGGSWRNETSDKHSTRPVCHPLVPRCPAPHLRPGDRNGECHHQAAHRVGADT